MCAHKIIRARLRICARAGDARKEIGGLQERFRQLGAAFLRLFGTNCRSETHLQRLQVVPLPATLPFCSTFTHKPMR